MRKFFAIIMSIVLCFSFSVSAFAETPEIEKHTITITVPAKDNQSTNENDISPCMWDQGSYTLGVGTQTFTGDFIIPNRYFAYEISGYPVNGGTSSESFAVYLCLSIPQVSVAGCSTYANNNVSKMDWLTVDEGEYYYFLIQNNTSQAIYVTITYYSWK